MRLCGWTYDIENLDRFVIYVKGGAIGTSFQEVFRREPSDFGLTEFPGK